ncbi:TetR family transcriptional regulator [Bacillus mangrovi]|uniref:TetR family transcriptional regulator n=1 Tax=Metabacillus mangrovi TaxID=1491830 RepID=A0A7X2S8L3_9BACI|nr:TetR/AcrR family transcriptional regulator [Metabacillus mangrovi]MTH55283.1 TetR family transcriptional regulator [Metabacillus mangrovi]
MNPAMPKVSESHARLKRKEILEAARRVCMQKSIFEVSMRDIVIETGMSQGGVYKYFSNIDEVFGALLNEESLNDEVKEEVHALFAGGDEPLQKLEKILMYIGGYMQRSLLDKGPVYYSLMDLYSRDKERYEKVQGIVKDVSNLQYLHEKFCSFLEEKIRDEAFKPVIPREDIILFIETYMSGMVNQVSIGNRPKQELSSEIQQKVRILFVTLNHVLVN